jgi:phage baseplate assembly protein W
MALYRGFSTVGRQGKFRVVDFELAKQDLINHLQISRGEKLMNADFGTSIWSFIFENNTRDLKSTLIQEVRRVVDSDPRLKLVSLELVDYEYGIVVDLQVLFTGTVNPVNLKLAFESGTNTVSFL